MAEKTVTIGGASGFWGETASSTAQLLGDGQLDYLVYDYLAEITMSIMARARAADPEYGYAADFVSAVLAPNLAQIAQQGVRVISNAGGVNPQACARAVRALVEQQGLNLKVAVVSGDDLLDRLDDFKNVKEMFSGELLPDSRRIASVNAYLGAFPIAAALDMGADIVITGRVVDSAVTLGACIHEFRWQPEDYDALAGGSVAGHILECGPQATGGNFTDWELVAESMHNIGYPIAEVHSDGSFVCRKPADTGGMVSIGTVAEQLLYEVGDPQAYVLPDVVCDFTGITLTELGKDKISVSGAKGYAPTDTYKVSATFADGFRSGQTLLFYGRDADRKARAFAKAALRRASERLQREGLGEFSDTLVELIGDESHYGEMREMHGSREVLLKVAARHPQAGGIKVLLQEVIGAALASPPGLTGFAGARPKPSPVVRLFSFLLDKHKLAITIDCDGEQRSFHPVAGQPFDSGALRRPRPEKIEDRDQPMLLVKLIELAWGRSGDKGDKANVGIIARQAQFLPYIWNDLTERIVGERFAHFTEAPVERYYLPGIHAVNFVLHDVLGGGGIASLRNDPQGKGYAQLLLETSIRVPEHMMKDI